ncbi:hypothetical protein HFN01_00800 [Rhizobium leguminosarum]|uniref:hypothetical protein n=1 Tax=Rhizobium leguminosarum TaxID=384 RepID=UPI001C980CC8|nr:hypothetical protein [Rhizobium leguminosarum]MBY5393359.1 hypothetical protein [Rhizobium leguminosarum]
MGTAGEHDAAPPESGETKFLDFVIGGKPGTARASAVAPLTMIEARAASARAFVDLGMFSRYLEWFSLFRLYRHVLVDQLVADARRQGFEPVMLTPLPRLPSTVSVGTLIAGGSSTPKCAAISLIVRMTAKAWTWFRLTENSHETVRGTNCLESFERNA